MLILVPSILNQNFTETYIFNSLKKNLKPDYVVGLKYCPQQNSVTDKYKYQLRVIHALIKIIDKHKGEKIKILFMDYFNSAILHLRSFINLKGIEKDVFLTCFLNKSPDFSESLFGLKDINLRVMYSYNNIIVPSFYAKEKITNLYQKVNVEKICFPLKTAFVKPNKSLLKIKKNPKQIVWAGDYKDDSYNINSLLEIASYNCYCKFIVFKYDNKVVKSSSNNVVFVCPKNVQEYYKYLAESSAVLITSKEEVYNFTFLEAVYFNCFPFIYNESYLSENSVYNEFIPRSNIFFFKEVIECEFESLIKKTESFDYRKHLEDNFESMFSPKYFSNEVSKFIEYFS